MNSPSWWVKRAIFEYINRHCRTIRIPNSLATRLLKYKRAIAKLQEGGNENPSQLQIADCMGMPLKHIRHLADASLSPVSLNAPLSQDGDADSLGSIVPDPSQDIQAHFDRDQRYSQLYTLIATLPQREQDLLKLRFGLGHSPESTLDNIGKKYRISRERVRQIEYKLLKELRKKLVKADAPINSPKN